MRHDAWDAPTSGSRSCRWASWSWQGTPLFLRGSVADVEPAALQRSRCAALQLLPCLLDGVLAQLPAQSVDEEHIVFREILAMSVLVCLLPPFEYGDEARAYQMACSVAGAGSNQH